MRDFVELSNNELMETNGGVGPLAIAGFIVAAIGGYIAISNFCYQQGYNNGRYDRGRGRHR